MIDTYKTIEAVSEGLYKEKGSKFIALAYPVRTEAEIKEILIDLRKKYYDARHVCYAYMLGHERKDFRANDDGEPSSTAGKPILGQINSNELTNILVVVVRYFGGTKLGVSGLIHAYKTSAADAIENGEILDCTVNNLLSIRFGYLVMNDVMRIIKEESLNVLNQDFDLNCEMQLSIRLSEVEKVMNRLEKVEGMEIKELGLG